MPLPPDGRGVERLEKALHGEAGESPALSRNCNPPATVKAARFSKAPVARWEARSPASVGFHTLAEGRGNALVPRTSVP